MPDYYLIEDAIRRAFIDESIRKEQMMYNLYFEWDDVKFV